MKNVSFLNPQKNIFNKLNTILNDSYSKIITSFNNTFSTLNKLNELIKQGSINKDVFNTMCKNFIETKDSFQNFYSHFSEILIVKFLTPERGK